jgi:hypothetical protein
MDFLSEDGNGGETTIQGCYRLLHCGFGPVLPLQPTSAAAFKPIGTQLTYVHLPLAS